MIELAVVLILLHTPDQREVRVSPEHITSMHSAKTGESNKLIVDDVRCLLHLSDGKNVGVVEACDVVQRLLEGE